LNRHIEGARGERLHTRAGGEALAEICGIRRRCVRMRARRMIAGVVRRASRKSSFGSSSTSLKPCQARDCTSRAACCGRARAISRGAHPRSPARYLKYCGRISLSRGTAVRTASRVTLIGHERDLSGPACAERTDVITRGDNRSAGGGIRGREKGARAAHGRYNK